MTGGNDDPLGAAEPGEDAAAAGGVTVEPDADVAGGAAGVIMSEGVKLTVSALIALSPTFAVSITVAVSPRRVRVTLPAPLSGFVV